MKKPIIIGLVTTATATGLIVGGLTVNKGGASFDLPGLNQKVQQQGEQLDNHEDRITNTENDVSDLQNSTGTPPSQNRQAVRAVTTPDPQPVQEPLSTQTEAQSTPQPEPTVRITSAVNRSEVSGDKKYYYCDLIYSDGHTQVYQSGVSTLDINLGYRCADLIGRESP